MTFHDTWYTSGMRGSGSLDFSVDAAFVPAARTIQPGVTRPVVDTPLARFPNFALLAAGVAAAGLGIARRALDEVIDLAQGKQPQFSVAHAGAERVHPDRGGPRRRPTARGAGVPARQLASTWDVARSRRRGDARRPDRHPVGGRPRRDDRGGRVTDAAFTLAGGTAVYDTSRLGRSLRDAHVVTQHIQTAPKLNETIGKLLLGVDVDTAMF